MSRRYVFMREWRLVRGMRQADLATAVGTAKSLISRYETGDTGMTIALQLQVMRALRITPNEFWNPPPAFSPDNPQRVRERQLFWKNYDQAGQVYPGGP